MRLHKPIGSLLLLWPTLWALWLSAKSFPDPLILSIFIVGVVIMRSAGCVINDIADRKIDGLVARTQYRPLAQKKITTRSAILLFISLCLIAFSLTFFLNALTRWLSVVAVILATIYPFTKRYTHWPQLVLGMAFAWAIPMAYAAQLGTVPAQAWVLYVVATVWSIIYDTEYAMVDRADDVKIGVKSTAVLFGEYDHLIIGIFQFVMLMLLLIIGISAHLNYWFFITLFVAAINFIYQQYLMKDRVPTNCFKAFMQNNWVGLMIFIGILLNY